MEPQQEEDSDNLTVGFTDEDAQTSYVFSQLQAYCLDLLELSKNSSEHSSSLSSTPSKRTVSFSQPLFNYTLFPLLLLLDAAVDNKSSVKESVLNKVSDSVAEDLLKCLEELLSKCQLGSVDQMVVVLKKLTYVALPSPPRLQKSFVKE